MEYYQGLLWCLHCCVYLHYFLSSKTCSCIPCDWKSVNFISAHREIYSAMSGSLWAPRLFSSVFCDTHLSVSLSPSSAVHISLSPLIIVMALKDSGPKHVSPQIKMETWRSDGCCGTQSIDHTVFGAPWSSSKRKNPKHCNLKCSHFVITSFSFSHTQSYRCPGSGRPG